MFWHRRSASYFVNMRPGVNFLDTPDLMSTKFEADRLCQNMTYITTKYFGFRVSLPLYYTESFLTIFFAQNDLSHTPFVGFLGRPFPKESYYYATGVSGVLELFAGNHSA